MSLALRRRECTNCGTLRLAENQRGQLYLACDCQNEVSIKVGEKVPEEWA